MKVLVCDDEHLARERLTRMVDQLEGYQVIAQAKHGQDALEQLQTCHADIVILDIRMPVMDGLRAAQKICAQPNPPAILFCTAYDQHAIEAFKVNAVDYLLKPVRPSDLEQALERAQKLNRVQIKEIADTDNTQKKHIAAKTHRGVELIPVNEILYFLADQKYVTVYHNNGEVLIDDTLKELETELEVSFIRIHRNALISKNNLLGMTQVADGQYQVSLRGTGKKLTVSRRHVAGLRRLMQQM